jgi:hypothetical protein
MKTHVPLAVTIVVIIFLILAPHLRATGPGAVVGTYSDNVTQGFLGGPGVGASGFSPHAIGVSGSSTDGTGVRGVGGDGVHGITTVMDGNGVFGEGSSSVTNTAAVFAFTTGTTANSSYALYASAPNGTAVYAESTNGRAGDFVGNVNIAGTLTKSAGAFRIDHPLDPANKYLLHSFVESDEMKNVYDGVVRLDRRGEAVVTLPKWFEALNHEFRYQLTCIGEHAPVYIAEEVHDNQFRIAGGYEGMKVSWQLTGVRHDAYAVAHPIVVEEIKPLGERGRVGVVFGSRRLR